MAQAGWWAPLPGLLLTGGLAKKSDCNYSCNLENHAVDQMKIHEKQVSRVHRVSAFLVGNLRQGSLAVTR
jgi:hypothetical protein